jgi:hypothetical protein
VCARGLLAVACAVEHSRVLSQLVHADTTTSTQRATQRETQRQPRRQRDKNCECIHPAVRADAGMGGAGHPKRPRRKKNCFQQPKAKTAPNSCWPCVQLAGVWNPPGRAPHRSQSPTAG